MRNPRKINGVVYYRCTNKMTLTKARKEAKHMKTVLKVNARVFDFKNGYAIWAAKPKSHPLQLLNCARGKHVWEYYVYAGDKRRDCFSCGREEIYKRNRWKKRTIPKTKGGDKYHRGSSSSDSHIPSTGWSDVLYG